MELVYLWVEEYKNIKNQGLNFSPKFTCHFDGENLTITPKQHIENFFGDNINITAIVGENGSGKSTILEIIKLLLINEQNKAFLVWESNQTFFYQSTMGEVQSIHKIIKKEKSNINFFTHSSDVFNTLIWMNQKNKLYDCNNPMTFGTFQVHNPNNLRMTHISLNIPMYYTYSQNIVLYYFLQKAKNNKIFNPTKYKFMTLYTYFVRKLTDILGYYLSESEKSLEKIKQEVQSYAQKITSNPKNLKIINRLYIFLEKLQSNNDIKAYGFYQYMKEFKIPSSEEMENLILESYGENFSSTLDSLDNLDLENLKLLENDKDLLLTIMRNELSKNIFTDVYQIILYEPTETDLYKTYDDLSTGEKDSLLLIALIYKSFEKEQKQDSIILLDEIETFYHPNWAKNFFNLLFEEIKDRELHLIMTSHSPLLLSDIPKENVIFLEKGKQVYPNIETFGANIHTLLSHGFFMKEGLMGEFAKRKINEVIKYLNQKELTPDEINYCENIISIIGEPILKRQLQKMLDSKRLSEVETIKKQIAELQQKLEEHQHAQN